MLHNFQADSAAEVAFEIEKKGKSADFDGVPANIDELGKRIAEVHKMLRDLVEQQSDRI